MANEVEGVVVTSFRQLIADHMAGNAVLMPIKYIAFGDGGHDTTTMEPLYPSELATGLNHELLRKEISYRESGVDPCIASGVGIVERAELNGVPISECALYTEDNQLIGLRNFAPKFKESDERYEFKLKLRF